MDIKIVDLKPGMVSGVTVRLYEDMPTAGENWYEYTCYNTQAAFKADKLDAVFVKMKKNPPVFTEVEMHEDTEVQLYVKGDVIALFVDVKDEKADLSTAQLVRIKEGTCIAIEKGKGHFVPVGTGDEPSLMAVTAPDQAYPHYALPETIVGIE